MIFLIDYENVHNNGLSGIEKLTETDKLVFFLRETDTFSALNHIRIERSPVQRKYIFVTATTKNALDFQLVAYLSVNCEKNKEEKYRIISNDQGYDAAVSFLRKEGYDVARGAHIKNVAVVEENEPAEIPSEEHQEKPEVPVSEAKEEKITEVQKEAAPEPKKEKPVSKNKTAKPETSISSKKVKELVSQLTPNKVDQITQIANNYKTKQSIHKYLVKMFNQDMGTKVYKAIRPLLKNKS